MKKLTTLLFILSVAISLSAQEAKTVFANIPDSLYPLLTAVNRADFIDFLESNMAAKVKNKLGGESEMTTLSNSYIRIQTTDKSVWEMKLLPVSEEKKIVCIVSTACGPVCDSSIKFFTTDWKELPATEYITLPSADDFFQAPSQEKLNEYNQLKKKADIFLRKAELDKDTNKLTFAYTTPEYMEGDDKKEILTYIQAPLVYEWDGEKFYN
ncbi:DUF3256 family protein [Bacteroides sp. 519]|uniref:DUF3256 family protein n=1 Tax=Bacteroides sp. 519 TaxID=2302937 RepID=UPI0013D4DFF9|nr:DUF3256 family protein [Bacteroides sp. 519]NDV57891.1 DUF3256 family protein [Bacteroides sp. 519]